MPLERAAVGIIAFTGVRPGEARGLRWEDWDRAQQQLKIERSIWHTVEGTPKTAHSVRFVAVCADLRVMLLDLWEKQGRPFPATCCRIRREAHEPRQSEQAHNQATARSGEQRSRRARRKIRTDLARVIFVAAIPRHGDSQKVEPADGGAGAREF
jgi:integrase